MARGRRRGSNFRFAKDWVQNQYTYDMIDGVTIQEGALGGVGLPLTFSDQTRVLDIAGDEFSHSWAAIPEGKGARTYAVRGNILVEPVNWTSGSSFTMFMRIVVKTMDFETLAASTGGNYTLCNAGAYVWADESFCWQHVLSEGVSPAGAPRTIYNVRVDAKCNRRLDNTEALFIILESVDGSVDCRCRLALRTLCAIRDDS